MNCVNFAGLLFVVALSAASRWADAGLTNAPAATVTEIVPADNAYAKEAAMLQLRGQNFDQILAALCRRVLANTDADSKLAFEDQVRSMFGGLWLWTQDGTGNPTLQGRMDWAFHFIGGGAFEGYWDVGRSAAVIKERVDARDPHNRFDLDDMAATMFGARWMNLAVNTGRTKGRQWVELWASGQYTVSKSIPKLSYGQMPSGKIATQEAIAAIAREVDQALTLPAAGSSTTAPTPPPPAKD